ncbi:MAG: Rpn family recombination-promoting nuclease/putative transposase [Okeania sp. SIO3I5]|uniref:Rpn family recombination-promoting nuclease/putative transposase n=1 Tax=Okeania sp. SIO3I5 TaxID=2607805 RepID=UPI0013B5EFE8|nr:Rpn family recombination-promoting nuclease/putative transposase [Okeania sp. SIO3I5]NEQ36833.1 Rpn family recombination-promoting nuclease/putative transposase [Okeania sp. SIO3I5]
MKFINPKVDYAFKKIFGSQQSQDILISFLNAIIYGGKTVIQSLTILNPYNPGQLINLKDTYLDIKAVLVDGSIVVIEMQVARMAGFNKRVAYNLAKAYANQLETGEDYLLLNPAIAVTITDFILFEKSDNFINKFVFKEETKNFECLDKQLRLIFLELPKFKKALSELNSLTDKWIYFLKEATRLDSIPENLGEVSEREKALNIANRINLTVEELDIVERRAIAMQDERGRIIYAEEQGEEKGRLKQAIALIMRLLKKRFGEIPATISNQIESLVLEDLEILTEDILDFNSLEDLEIWLQEHLPS